MSTVNSDAIKPRDTGLDITLGAAGDTTVISANSINTNTVKDSGGNTLWISDGGGTLSSVNAGLKCSQVLLATNTITTSTASTGFTSLIDSTYKVYKFQWSRMAAASDRVDLKFQTSIDGGSNYNVNLTSSVFFCYASESAGTGALSYNSGMDQANGTSYQALFDGQGNAADESCVGELWLYNHSNTSYVKHYYSVTNNYMTDNFTENYYTAGYFNTTSAINAINFQWSSGNITNGSLKMYGIL